MPADYVTFGWTATADGERQPDLDFYIRIASPADDEAFVRAFVAEVRGLLTDPDGLAHAVRALLPVLTKGR